MYSAPEAAMEDGISWDTTEIIRKLSVLHLLHWHQHNHPERERREKIGPSLPWDHNVSHTGWVRNESVTSSTAASGTCNLYRTWGHLQDQNDTASNFGLKNIV